jgi:predicted xylose isomerase-like sugar epimerase
MFGAMPSHGFFLRHVKNVSMSNVEIRCLEEDLRPACVLQDVQGADFFRIRAPRAKGTAMFSLNNVGDFNAYRCKGVPDTQVDHADKKKL